MRSRHIITICLFLAFFFFVGTRLAFFIQIFFKHAGIEITQHEIVDRFSGEGEGDGGIPKIIHHVFHNWHEVGNETLREDYRDTREKCRGLNEGWEFQLWTEKNSSEFIREHYPWFLKTYEGYKFPVQRVDAVRYFLLRHFGGIYLDLDNGCLTSFTPLTHLQAFSTDGGRGALSNNILGSVPEHPFWVLITESLRKYDWNYVFPYITISYASGQWFETAVWQTYHASLKPSEQDKAVYRIMMDDRPGTDPWIFFTQEQGGSWVNWDNAFFLWIGDHLVLEGVGFIVLVGGVWWGLRRCCWGGKRTGYSKVRESGEAVGKREEEGSV